MDAATKQVLEKLRLALVDKSEREYDHARTLPLGTPARVQRVGHSIGLNRAAQMVETLVKESK